MTAELRDCVMHGGKRFGMAHSNVDRLQGAHTCGAFGEVGVGVHKDLQRPVETDQQIRKIPLDDSRQVGP